MTSISALVPVPASLLAETLRILRPSARVITAPNVPLLTAIVCTALLWCRVAVSAADRSPSPGVFGLQEP